MREHALISSQGQKLIPYFFDDSFHIKLKNIMTSCGFTEAMNLSLISKDLIEKCRLKTNDHIKISNPVSIEYQYLRSSLIPLLLNAIKINNNEKNVLLFEIGKTYHGAPGKTTEPYLFSGVARGSEFNTFKGCIDLVLEKLNIDYQIILDTDSDIWHQNKAGTIVVKKQKLGYFGQINPIVVDNFDIKDEIYAFEFYIDALEVNFQTKMFKPVPEFPAQVEDITLTIPNKIKVGDVVAEIKNFNDLIASVEAKDVFKDSYTFRIRYQSLEKTLNNSEIEPIRKGMLKLLSKEFGVYQK